MNRRAPLYLVVTVLSLVAFVPARAAGLGPGVGNVPQGVQSDAAYARSVFIHHVTNVFATAQKTSCYTPEVPYGANAGPNDGYDGESACAGAATTGEDLGPYPSQKGSNPGYPASAPVLVKDHSESDLQVDPTNPNHLIGSSKWFVSAEGYNHLLGFYESFDGGKSWPAQGHIPGYEGWTDNTDPVGAFDAYGNYYEFILAYQFFYRTDGTKSYQTNQNLEPNPVQPAETVSVAVRSHGAATARDWITTHNGHLDHIATYDSVGQEPDKQWITIDTHKTLPNGEPNPNYNMIYAMWVVYDGLTGSKPYYSTARALPDGTHTDWTAPQVLPTMSGTASDTYLLPHVAPDGTVYTSVTNFPSKHSYCCVNIGVDYSTDGGKTWQGTLPVAGSIQDVPNNYANTTFSSGIEDTFAVGNHLSAQGYYPLYASWEDASAGITNTILSASYDGGRSWTALQVNDNASRADAFQPNLTVAADGTVSVAFYDRRLSCPAAGTAEATGAGIALDQSNPNYAGSMPPYGAANYCVNVTVQFYTPTLNPIGNNIRLTQHTWDPQLSAPNRYGGSDTTTFIGDYFGNTTAGSINLSSFVSTYDDGSNPHHYQQQVVASIAIP